MGVTADTVFGNSVGRQVYHDLSAVIVVMGVEVTGMTLNTGATFA